MCVRHGKMAKIWKKISLSKFMENCSLNDLIRRHIQWAATLHPSHTLSPSIVPVVWRLEFTKLYCIDPINSPVKFCYDLKYIQRDRGENNNLWIATPVT